MCDYCSCGAALVTDADLDNGRCPACQASYERDLAYYAPLYRAGALDPVKPWRSRDDLIREWGDK